MRLRTSWSERNASPKNTCCGSSSRQSSSQQRHISLRYGRCSSNACPGESANKRNTTSYSSETSHSLIAKRLHAVHGLIQALVKHGCQQRQQQYAFIDNLVIGLCRRIGDSQQQCKNRSCHDRSYWPKMVKIHTYSLQCVRLVHI